MDIVNNEVFGDKYIEENRVKIEKALVGADNVIDFSNIKWFELTSLILFLSIIVRRISSIDKLKIILPIIKKSSIKNNSLLFFLKCGIVDEIINLFIANDKIFELSLSFDGFEEKDVLSFRRTLYGLSNVLSADEDFRMIVLSKSYGRYFKLLFKASDISNTELVSYQNIKKSIDGLYGFDSSDIDDFLFPMKVIRKKELEELGEKGILSYIEHSFGQAKGTLPESRRFSLDSIKKVWAYELFLNMLEHGGDCGIVCIRLGRWEVRDKNIYCVDRSDFYTYKNKYYQNREELSFSDFIDMHFLDSGSGFYLDGLVSSYNSENIVKLENKKDPIRALHNYALSPSSSRKNLPGDDTRVTGLGLIAQKIIDNDAVLAIKDRDELTYFDKNSVEKRSSIGKDYVSTSDFMSTCVTAIVPIDDISWEVKNSVADINIEGVDFGRIAYVRFDNSVGHLDMEVVIVSMEVGSKYHQVESSFESLVRGAGIDLVLIDVRDIVINKSEVNMVYEAIKHLKKEGLLVILVNADMSAAKILKSILFANINNAKYGNDEEYVFCFAITVDFKIIAIGKISSDRQGEVTKKIVGFEPLGLSDYHCIYGSAKYRKNRKIPFYSIERIINKVSGQVLFNSMIKKSYLSSPIYNKDGAVLDSYYQVKTYLGDYGYIEFISKDLLRIISRVKPESILVDCPELILLVHLAVEKTQFLNIDVNRIGEGDHGNKVIDIESGSALVFLSSVYSGKTLDLIEAKISNGLISKCFVYSILDLQNRSKSDMEKTYSFSYDFLTKADPPKQLTTHLDDGIVYAVNKYSRVVPIHESTVSDSLESYCVYDKRATLGLLRKSNSFYYGHIHEHGHHYSNFFDVRGELRFKGFIYNLFINKLEETLSKNVDAVIYIEESEVWPVLHNYIIRKRLDDVGVIEPVRQTLSGDYCFVNFRKSPVLNGKNIVLIDEGLYSARSLISVIKMLLKGRPKKIEILVVEYRPSFGANLNELISIVGGGGCTEVSFRAIIAPPSRQWNDDNCPMCRLGLGFKKFENDYFDLPLQLTGINVYSTVELLMWFEGQIQHGRTSAIGALRLFIELISADRVMARRTYYTLISNFESIESWSIWGIVCSYIENCIKVFTYSEKILAIKLINRLSIENRKRILVKALSAMITDIVNNTVMWEMYRMASLDDTFVEITKEIMLNKCSVYDPKIIKRWTSVYDANKDISIVYDLMCFYSLTMVNREDNHTKLHNELLADYRGNGRIVKPIFKRNLCLLESSLESICSVVGDSGSPFCDLRDVLRDPEAFSSRLNDMAFVEEINKCLTPTACYVWDKLSDVVDSCDPAGFDGLVVLDGRKNISTMPILCISHDVGKLLCDHIKDNRSHGPSSISCQRGDFDGRDCVVFDIVSCDPSKIVDIGIAEKKSGYIQLNAMLSPFGGKMKYVIDADERFKTEIYLKVVDHVKV